MLDSFMQPIQHRWRASTLNMCFFQQSIDVNHRELQAILGTFGVINIHDMITFNGAIGYPGHSLFQNCHDPTEQCVP